MSRREVSNKSLNMKSETNLHDNQKMMDSTKDRTEDDALCYSKQLKSHEPSESSYSDSDAILEDMPSSESLLYETQSQLLSSDPVSLLAMTPISFSAASSTTSMPSFELFNSSQYIPLAADISASLLTSSNNPGMTVKAMEDNPELMVVMERVENGLLSACKRVAMVLQEAIRQREEATLSNEVDTRNFNESKAMGMLKKYEIKEKLDLEELEDWYEDEVSAIESSYAPQLEIFAKELEDYRSSCFVKADEKEKELNKQLKDDPPERAARIRSQVLERYHNKLIEGEKDIQDKRHEIKQAIHQAVRDVEREYQKRRRAIEKEFSHASHSVKQELVDRKRTVRATCNERRDKAHLSHSTAIESCRDILNEVLMQAKDVFVKLYSYYHQIKRIHLFCDVRVHEQIKKMSSIQGEIDSFQSNCDTVLQKQQPVEMDGEERVESDSISDMRADVFIQSTIRMQSELIGRALLEINDDNTGFHSRVTTLREQFTAEVASTLSTPERKRRWLEKKHDVVDQGSLKQKYVTLVITSAQQELEQEYKRCVKDIVDFASNSSRLFYRETALRYWLLLMQYKERGKEENTFELLAAANQEILNRFASSTSKTVRMYDMKSVAMEKTGDKNSVKQDQMSN